MENTSSESVPVDAPHLRVVGIIAPSDCHGGQSHVGGVVLEDESELTAGDAVALIDAGRVLFMIPPPGAPAYAVHAATGLPLIVQVRECPGCGNRVLFA